MADTHYIELAVRDVSNRGLIVPLSELGKYVAQAKKPPYAELYRSHYEFDETILEHAKSHKTPSGFQGTVFLSHLLFDIDCGQSTGESARAGVLQFIEVLDSDSWIPADQCRVWFSGRGFHVVTPDFFGFKPSNTLPAEVKATISKCFPQVDQAIYDLPDLIRVGNTINRKSMLFKIPLTTNELHTLGYEGIQELAKTPRKDFKWEYDWEEPTKLHADKIVVPTTLPAIRKHGPITPSNAPTIVATCMQKLYLSDHMAHRHEHILRIASTWRRQGMPAQAIIDALVPRYHTLEKEEIERGVHKVFQVPYQFGCNDPIMQQWCDAKCKFYENKDFGIQASTSKELEAKLVKFVRQDWQDISFDLKEIWPAGPSFRFYPGDYVTIMGDTGIGKTAWVQNIIVPLKRMQTTVLSLEVHDILFFRRCIQIEYGWTKEQVIQHYQLQDNTLSSKLSHIKVVTVSPTLEAIKDLIVDTNSQIIVVDVIDGISVPKVHGDTEKLGIIADKLKQLAQATNTIIFGVSHISKQAALSGNLNVHSAKGSSGIEQKSDTVIAIEGNREMNNRVVHSLKARDENPFRMPMTMDSSTFRFTTIDY